VRAKPN